MDPVVGDWVEEEGVGLLSWLGSPATEFTGDHCVALPLADSNLSGVFGNQTAAFGFGRDTTGLSFSCTLSGCVGEGEAGDGAKCTHFGIGPVLGLFEHPEQVETYSTMEHLMFSQ